MKEIFPKHKIIMIKYEKKNTRKYYEATNVPPDGPSPSSHSHLSQIVLYSVEPSRTGIGNHVLNVASR